MKSLYINDTENPGQISIILYDPDSQHFWFHNQNNDVVELGEITISPLQLTSSLNFRKMTTAEIEHLSTDTLIAHALKLYADYEQKDVQPVFMITVEELKLMQDCITKPGTAKQIRAVIQEILKHKFEALKIMES